MLCNPSGNCTFTSVRDWVRSMLGARVQPDALKEAALKRSTATSMYLRKHHARGPLNKACCEGIVDVYRDAAICGNLKVAYRCDEHPLHARERMRHSQASRTGVWAYEVSKKRDARHSKREHAGKWPQSQYREMQHVAHSRVQGGSRRRRLSSPLGDLPFGKDRLAVGRVQNLDAGLPGRLPRLVHGVRRVVGTRCPLRSPHQAHQQSHRQNLHCHGLAGDALGVYNK
jgi:hypothetical protein